MATVFTSELTRSGPTDTYPGIDILLVKGGWITVYSTAERDALLPRLRKSGMLVRVKSVSEDVVYSLDTNLTGWTVFLDLSLYVTSAMIGAANGIAPLNAGQTIDPVYLGITLSVPLEGYDAATNTPNMSDATGNANEYTFITVAGTQNLGSGNLVMEVGNFLYHDGTKWNLVPTTGFGVSSVNGLSGVVTINSPTDDEMDGISANSPTAGNPLVTQSQLTAAISVGTTFLNPEMFGDGHDTDGTIQTLADLGYTLGTATAAWGLTASMYPGGISTAFALDTMKFQELFYTMQTTGAPAMWCSQNGYCPNRTLYLPTDQLAVPLYQRTKRFTFNINSNLYNRTGAAFIMLDKYPADQADSTFQGRNTYAYIFNGLTMNGDGDDDAANIGLRLGGTSHSVLNYCEFGGFDVSVQAQFCLEMTFNDCEAYDYATYGFEVGNGTWSGAAFSNAQSNGTTFNKPHLIVSSGRTPRAGVYLNGSHTNVINSPIFEGVDGAQHHILYESLGGAVCENLMTINEYYNELAGASIAAIKAKGRKGQIRVQGLRSTPNPPQIDVLIALEHYTVAELNTLTPGNTGVVPMLCKFIDSPVSAIDSVLGNYSDRAQGLWHRWIVDNVKMNDNVTFNTAENFDTTGTGRIPVAGQFNFNPSLL